ncbi:MAG: ATP-binding protein [Pyrinomonadaceae bacterium]
MREEFSLPSRIESVDIAAMRIDEFARRAGIGEDFVGSIDLAVRESVANAVKHGNNLDESKSVDITLEITAAGFEMQVRDYGEGFDLAEVPDPTDPENLLKSSGRGILFMQAFMDIVEWTRHDDGGTVVRMVKRR